MLAGVFQDPRPSTLPTALESGKVLHASGRAWLCRHPKISLFQAVQVNSLLAAKFRTAHACFIQNLQIKPAKVANSLSDLLPCASRSAVGGSGTVVSASTAGGEVSSDLRVKLREHFNFSLAQTNRHDGEPNKKA
jgi:hypothetical protein